VRIGAGKRSLSERYLRVDVIIASGMLILFQNQPRKSTDFLLREGGAQKYGTKHSKTNKSEKPIIQ